MAVTVDDLKREVNTGAPGDADVLTKCLNNAKTLLDAYVAAYADAYVDATNTGVPEGVFDQAWLVMAVDAFNRRKAPNGILNQAFAAGDGAPVPVRISSDPLRAARPLLSMWCTEVAFS